MNNAGGSQKQFSVTTNPVVFTTVYWMVQPCATSPVWLATRQALYKLLRSKEVVVVPSVVIIAAVPCATCRAVMLDAKLGLLCALRSVTPLVVL